MIISDWESLKSQLDIIISSGRQAPLPTTDDLDRFELKVGFRLPTSYRGFLTAIGPGQFPAMLAIASPYCKDLGYDLSHTNAKSGYSPESIVTSDLPDAEKERLGRLYYFGLERGKYWLGWDVNEMYDSMGIEYAIYRVDSLNYAPELVAFSFHGMMEDICDSIFSDDPEYDDETMGSRRAFVPAIDCNQA